MFPIRGANDNTLSLQAQFAELRGTIETYMEMNSRQHGEIRELLFGDTPNSLQGQINVMSERAFGDGPTSLKSRLAEIEGAAKVSKGIWAFIAAFFASVGTLVGLKWEALAKLLRSLGH